MPFYLYNQSRWDGKYHEVHTDACTHLPKPENRIDLGWHSSCKDAIREAERKTGDRDFDGCYYCCKDCHKG